MEFYIRGPPVTATTPVPTRPATTRGGRSLNKEGEQGLGTQHEYVQIRYADERQGISVVCEAGEILVLTLPYHFECKPKTDTVNVLCVGPPTSHPDLGTETPVLVRFHCWNLYELFHLGLKCPHTYTWISLEQNSQNFLTQILKIFESPGLVCLLAVK